MKNNYNVEMRLGVQVPMRDGVNLAADLYLPDGKGPFPTVLLRTPYSKNMDAMITKGRSLANKGYACAIQDCRGRWDSDGEFYPLREGKDGYDTQEWVGRQDWSDGKIGMSGGSYVGLVQWQSAPYQSGFLHCMAPRAITCDFYRGLAYPGGAFQLNVMMTWGMRTNGRTAQSIEYHNWTEAFRALPLKEMDEQAGRRLGFWKDWVGHSSYDAYWEEFNDEEKWGEIVAPALNMGGWYDLYAPSTFINFNGLRLHGGTPEARRSKLIVGPWPHALSTSTRTGDIDFGAGSMVNLDGLELRWFDYWLKGIDNGIVEEPPLQLFIMGINQWRAEHEWPLARTRWQHWYLDSGGNGNSLLGDGVLATQSPRGGAVDTFLYDPLHPVQTVGGNNCCSPHIVPWGPYDQRPVEMRSDVLCYTSAPMDDDLEVTGPIQAVLYAATNCIDTDWTAKLVDVSPNGYAKNLCDGIIRARYRDSRSHPKLLISDKVYEYRIDLGVTGNVFLLGHRIRVEVSSSNFPRFDRNLNTGHDLGADSKIRMARQKVYHNTEYPSHLLLPVI